MTCLMKSGICDDLPTFYLIEHQRKEISQIAATAVQEQLILSVNFTASLAITKINLECPFVECCLYSSLDASELAFSLTHGLSINGRTRVSLILPSDISVVRTMHAIDSLEVQKCKLIYRMIDISIVRCNDSTHILSDNIPKQGPQSCNYDRHLVQIRSAFSSFLHYTIVVVGGATKIISEMLHTYII